MMAAGNYSFIVEQGATYAEVFTWQQSNGTPINLTGYTAQLQIHSTGLTPSTIATLTTTSGNIQLGGALGTIAVTIPASTTAAWDFNKAIYELVLTSSSGIVTRLLKGNIKLDKI